ncbi:MAG: 3-phosphoshikimate 1-carboxyvinyltransferase [Gammaproteobacteria bacterium]|nr:3-phosphoshikimate 1-carboxyvinyltransferase [Gammaproteobacteria bacterium]
MSKLILPIEAPFEYELALPGSKSIALRQLLISALASKDSTIFGLPPCGDVDAMLDSLKNLGTEIDGSLAEGLRISPNLNLVDNIELDARQSGVSLRLLLATAALRRGTTHFTGHVSLANRPNSPLLNAIKELGCTVESDEGKLPITISSDLTNNSSTSLDSTLSSQFLSALLIVGARFPNGLEIQLLDRVASAQYAEGTIGEMEKRGVVVHQQLDNTRYKIEPQMYEGGNVQVEGDASAATYHMALATLHGGTVHLTNLGNSSWQPDSAFAYVCERLGATIEQDDTRTTVRGANELQPIEAIDMSEMPDAAPTLMAMSPYLSDPIEITGLSTLRHKECDRIACPARELTRAGIQVEEGSDFLKIWPGIPKPTVFDTYDDHRMAMSFAVLASKTDGCRINDPLCVNKTYTDFWYDMSRAYV